MLNLRLSALAAAVALLTACATTPQPVPLPSDEVPTAIEGGAAVDATADSAAAAPLSGAMASSTSSGSGFSGRESFPINAKAGECYARVVNPPKFETRSEKMLAKAESERIEIIPAKYETVEEKVLVKAAGKKIVEIIPAVYKTVETMVVTKPASEKIEQVPAVFKDMEETQLIKPATTQWKKGRGPIEKYDGLTGEIMCLVTVPAEYRTVKRRVVASPAEVKRIPIPAQYGTVLRQELLKPAEVREIDTPAEYKTVRTLKMVTPAEEKRIPIPAQYQTIASQVLVSEGKAEWKSILCQTNTTPGIVQDIQRALLAKGFNPGKIDGIIGVETSAAVRAFQTANGLATGGLTMDTLDKLGVSMSQG
ncbi:MAG: peptidoglycan-binding domain-containing protein [Pseudomonadota bacterium]